MKNKFTILGCGSSLGSPWITNYKGKLSSNIRNIRTRCCAHIKKKKFVYNFFLSEQNDNEIFLSTIFNSVLLEVILLLGLILKFDIKKNLIGNSVAMQKISGLIHKASSSRINVCIRGESGTGKEVVAKSIHFNSEAHNKPFIAINVSAIPENLIESELFGYEKGAFTGADKANPGKFEAAGEGTIFLDEIGEMSLAMQAKLLRVIQEREVTRIGSHKKLKIKCRILTATHKDLISEISKGNFREDLYYRIIGLPIVLPPLRDRKEDIPLLCKKFINESCEYNGLDSIELSQEALDKLIKYNFKGNIRELKAIIDLSTILCKNNIITSEDIQLNEARNIDNLTSQNLSLKEMNNKIIYHFLNKHNNNVLKVAQLLDVGKSTIYRLLKEEKQ